MIKAYGKYETNFKINVIGYAKSFLWNVPVFKFQKVKYERVYEMDKWEPKLIEVK